MQSRLRRIGLDAGKPFETATLDPVLVEAIDAAGKDALEDLGKSVKTGLGTRVNGWIGALAGLGVNLPADAVSNELQW